RSRLKASASDSWRCARSAPAKTTGWPSTSRVVAWPVASSASVFRRLSTTLTSVATLKSSAHELVPAKPIFASSCLTPDSSRASLQPPPLRYCRQSVSQPYGASGQRQQSVFSWPLVREVLTPSDPASRCPERCWSTDDVWVRL